RRSSDLKRLLTNALQKPRQTFGQFGVSMAQDVGGAAVADHLGKRHREQVFASVENTGLCLLRCEGSEDRLTTRRSRRKHARQGAACLVIQLHQSSRGPAQQTSVTHERAAPTGRSLGLVVRAQSGTPPNAIFAPQRG